MDIYQIQYFLKIIETGSFTKAAEQLFVSQTSLSVGIKKLEKELGVKLFERGGPRVLLTPSGRFFQEKAEIIFQEYQATLDELKNTKYRPALKLGAIHTLLSSTGVKPHGVYFADDEEWVIALIRVGLGVSIMPLWNGLTDITYVSVCDMDLSRTIGLQWRQKQNATVVDWFRSVAAGYDWQVLA